MSLEWIENIQGLYDYLVLNDKRLDLLDYIDHRARDLAISKDPEAGTTILGNLLREIVERLQRLSGADRSEFFVNTGTEVISTYTSGQPGRSPTLARKQIPSEIRSSKFGDSFGSFTRSGTDGALNDGLGAEVVLPVPLFTNGNEPFGYVFLQTLDKEVGSPLLLPGNQRLAQMVSLQLSNVLTLYEQIRRRQFEIAVAGTFFEQELDPQASFKSILDHVRKFLPSIGPLELIPPPELQLLLHKEGQMYLRVIATTGTESLLTRVKVDQSFCGRLISEPELFPNYRLDDPRNDPHSKSYLGDMRTELAARIELNGNGTAILNLESANEDAFKEPHVIAVQEACQSLKPMINAMVEMQENTSYAQRATNSAADKYLGQLATILRHETRTPMSNIGMRVQRLRRIRGSDDNSSNRELDVIERNVARLKSSVKEFAQNIEGFSQRGPNPVRDLISGVMKRVMDEERLEGRNISIVIERGPEIEIYCSGLFRRHIDELLRNSIYWIDERFVKLGAEPPGVITIRIKKERLPRGKTETDLNKRCVISIKDNGLGATDEDLRRIRSRSRFSGRSEDGGTGVGIQAAKEYVNGMGGEMIFKGEEGKFFEVTIYLDIYDPRVHSMGS